MITQLILDTKHAPAGTPVRFVEWETKDCAFVQLPNGKVISVPAAHIASGINGPEQTMRALADQTGISYDTLVKAARESRLLARRSGTAWLSTVQAVKYAIEVGTIRPRS